MGSGILTGGGGGQDSWDQRYFRRDDYGTFVKKEGKKYRSVLGSLSNSEGEKVGRKTAWEGK